MTPLWQKRGMLIHALNTFSQMKSLFALNSCKMRQLTSWYYMKYTRLPLPANRVVGETQHGSVLSLRTGRIVQDGSGSVWHVGYQSPFLKLLILCRVVEGPMEAQVGRVGVHVAGQGDAFSVSHADHLWLAGGTDGGVWNCNKVFVYT